MFSKFQPQAFGQESKPQAFSPEPKSQVFVAEPKLKESEKEVKKTPASKTEFFTPESKPPTSILPNPKSCETGEPEAETKTFTLKPKTDKPLTNLFAMATSTPLPSPNVPDVLRTTQDVKTEYKAPPKPVEKEKSKENVPEKVDPKVISKPVGDKNGAPKPLTIQTANKTSIFGTTPAPVVTSSSTPISSKIPNFNVLYNVLTDWQA